MRTRRSVGLATVLLGAAVLLVGCDGSAPAPDPLLSTPSFSASVPPTGSTVPPASASSATQILPESTLTEVKPYTYSTIPGSEKSAPPEIEQLATYFDGYVGRQIERDGKSRGTVQLLRTKPGVLGDEASGDKVLEAFLTGFSKATDFDRTPIAGTDVLVAKVPASSATIAGWRQGRDLILLLAAPSLSATDFARAYLTA